MVALNTLIGYAQESRAEAALDALRAMTRSGKPGWLPMSPR